ncbi:MAG: hypothetical protein Q9178_002736 [Gyalolechia marmorata]
MKNCSPKNRKIRHLEGISLRNLSLLQSSAEIQEPKTADDESLPHTFITPTKALALREKKLEHSRSSNDLRTPPTSRQALDGTNGKGDSSTDLGKVRPLRGKIRRRSTLNWTSAPPQVRQKKLEDVASSRLADTWFSLHCQDVDEPIYVSEVVEKAMNFDFRFFDLNTYGPWITRRDELTIKFWARTDSQQQYKLVLELQVHFRSLQYIGRSLENFRHPLPQNCVLLHLSDGIYTSFTDLPLDEPVLAISTGLKNAQGGQCTSTFDELMRLSNLDDCIQDALATREKITSQINSILQKQKEDRELVQSAAQAQNSWTSTKRAVSSAQKQIRAAQSRRSELQASLQARRDAIRSGTISQEKSESHLRSERNDLADQMSLHKETQSGVRGQIRRICEDLLQIYPVEPIAKKALAFTIRDLPLPNATSPSPDAATTAAALGYVAHVTHLLSLYLSVHLPYAITVCGSSSTIYDPISASLQSEAARTFPLSQKGAVAYRFEYGVFLLNSDIELLMSRQGIKIVDLRHTLPNLKYLLTVLTSGRGEPPERKGGKSGLGTFSREGSPARKLYTTDEDDGSVEEANGSLTRSLFLNGKKGSLRAQSPLGTNIQPEEDVQLPRRRPGRRRRRMRRWFRKWKELSFRHTWANPLIIILLVLALYAIQPNPTNPLHAAIFLSYPLSPSDSLIPAAIRADPEAPIHYGKGRKDFAFVAFYIVVLSFTREFTMQRILRPLARWFKLRSRSKENRFMEQTYTALYFGVFGPYGLYVMYRSPVWYFDTAGMYETFPNRTHEALFKAYYLLQASYWAQQALVLCLGLEKPRRDYRELVGHHIVTLALIGLSYRFHFTYMGLAVYITHDISDFFLASSKTLSYIDARFTSGYFAFFIAVWVYLRHYINLVILHSVTTTFASIGPFELNWEEQQYKCSLAQYITFSLLASLQAMNLFWLYFIARVAVRVLSGGEKKDDRSDEEDEDEDGKDEKEEKAREREKALMADNSKAVASATALDGKPTGANGHLERETQAPVTIPTINGEVKKRK